MLQLQKQFFIYLEAIGIARPSLTHQENQLLPQLEDKTVSLFQRLETQHYYSASTKPLTATAKLTGS